MTAGPTPARPTIAVLAADASTFPPFPFQVLITDPPYSAHVHSHAVSQSKVRGVRKRDLGFESLSHRNRRAVADAVTAAQKWALVYSDHESTAAMRIAVQARGGHYIRLVPWVRWSMPQLSGDRPPQGSEAVLLFHRAGKKSWNGPGNLTHLAHKCLRGEGKHKTEKPLDQMLDLVSWFSDPGDLVFDPFAGRGTTALACLLLGRSCVALEIDPEEAARAQARIQDAHEGRLSDRDTERLGRWLDSQDKGPVAP